MFDKVYALHKLLKDRRTAISRQDLESKLGLKRATMTRLISYCRKNLQPPIEFDKDKNGYLYQGVNAEHYELPGLWFNPSELIALMTSHRLLADVQPGVLQPYIAPLQERIEKLLQHKRIGSTEVFKRIRILPMAQRIAKLEEFQKVTDALVNRQQLRIQYASRGSSGDAVKERWVSPQRLIYYRDNWYLDAWCHTRQALRTFSIDRINVAEVGNKSIDIDDAILDAHVKPSYGIFAGQALQQAVIHFSSASAEWVADELWHPDQLSRHLGDGKWELVIPYNDPTELIRDILKYGPEAEVMAPAELRKQVEVQLSKALRQYRKLK